MRVRRSSARLAAMLLAAAALAACSTPQPAATPVSSSVPAASPTPSRTASVEPSSASPTPKKSSRETESATPRPSRTKETPNRALKGRTIVIDPGHNGVWNSSLNRQVPAGNGRTKACNSSGTATRSGYPEHAHNWDVARRLAELLRDRAAKVVLTRQNDHGMGPCVNIRAKIGNDAEADLVVSIHADGNTSRSARGLHIILSTTMVGGPKIEAASRAFGITLRDALVEGTGMPRSTYTGRGTGLSPRTDIAGLNLSQRPAAMIEMGNMMNPTDAALLSSSAFRQKAAEAIVAAIITTLKD